MFNWTTSRNNQPINNQYRGIEGYSPPNFYGYPDEDPEEFIDSFCSYLVAVGIDIAAGHAHKIRAHGPKVMLKIAVQLGANLRHGTMGQAGNIVIPAHTVFDEDWSFAGRRPTDRLPNAPNANARQTIVADGI
ncbi:hypothetical protein F8M41_005474 [Gigaspora margarita]|uniref:Uncharacterized protein n=1 Tax=Gigaspora margarita TaxID=4874 RepID=A0A8H4A4Y0_GIGMA|nr:hypothetical protein F8M41_005474 [Gigaspora margarita]